jgi:hypothetical protein
LLPACNTLDDVNLQAVSFAYAVMFIFKSSKKVPLQVKQSLLPIVRHVLSIPSEVCSESKQPAVLVVKVYSI